MCVYWVTYVPGNLRTVCDLLCNMYCYITCRRIVYIFYLQRKSISNKRGVVEDYVKKLNAKMNELDGREMISKYSTLETQNTKQKHYA